MRAIEISVHVTDRDRLDLGRLELCGERAHRRLVEWDQDVAAAVEPLGNAEAQLARHQRRRLLHEDVVLLEAMLEGYLDRIAEALGDDQRRLRTLALNDGVGGQRRAVDDQAEITGLQFGELEDLLDAGQHALFGRARRGQHLHAFALAVPFQRKIGEGAADIDGEARSVLMSCAHLPMLLSAGCCRRDRLGGCADRCAPRPPGLP